MDDRAAHAVNRRRSHPALDRGIAGLSRSADRGRLWMVVAIVLVVLGKRRAAIRGLASLGVASVVANLVGKKVFGGSRPLLSNVPLGRRLKNSPISPSFPSGHSASAWAFSVGVALESPRAGAAIAPLAGAVAYSRLHTGAHWLSDVLGGAAIGAAVAAIGRVVFPAHVLARIAPSPTRDTIELPALPEGEGALILLNPLAGRDIHRPDPAPELRRRLPKATIHRLQDGDDIAELIRHEKPDVVGIYGGDGSVAAAAGFARAAGVPLLVLPGGTFNHFALTAGLRSVGTAIDALQQGRGRRVDVAELSFEGGAPITVLNTASVGIYPHFVTEREKRERRLGKPLAAFVASLRVLPMADPIDVTINGEQKQVWSIFVGVNRYFPATAAPLQRRHLDDGLLDVRILHADRGTARIRGVLALNRRLPGVIETFTSESLTVSVHPRPDHDPGLAHDGETSPTTPGDPRADGRYQSHIRIVPGGLEIYSLP
jgi:undecaprenyl-diphosphatase